MVAPLVLEHPSFFNKGRLMKIAHLVLAFAALAPLSAAHADDLVWKKSPAMMCLMDRGDKKLAVFAAADENCGPIGVASRAPRGFVLSDAAEDAYRAANSGDAEGGKKLMGVLWQIQSRSPALASCWKTMVKFCDAAKIGEAIEAAKP
jgi:hypothetical protein